MMLIVHVHVSVKPECVEAFARATIENARQSTQEPGIARFDVVQQTDDPTRFVLVEMYRSLEAPAAHKETRHYQVWRDTVADMMAQPRSSVKFSPVFLTDQEDERHEGDPGEGETSEGETGEGGGRARAGQP